MKKIFLLGILASLLILPMVFAQSNLMMTDLEDISLDGLTVQTIEGGSFIFEVFTYPETFVTGDIIFLVDEIAQGYNWLNAYEIGSMGSGHFVDKEIAPEVELPTTLRLNTDLIADVRVGDYVTLTYDSEQTLDVYLPEVSGSIFRHLFIS
ncbi:unnamed protein product, partial [marine sediment metagenome]